MNTAEKIVSDPKNSNNGRVQHYLISEAAGKEEGVIMKGTVNKPYYKFVDGSSMTIDHILGDYDTDWPK